MENTRSKSIRKRTKLQPPKQSNSTTTTQHTNQIPPNNHLKQRHRKQIRPNNKTTNTNRNEHENTRIRNKNTNRTGETMKVQISDKEQNRIKQAESYFQSLGCETEITNLKYGDYIFNNKVAIEYKTMADFIASIQDNRVFNEAINQAENYDWHYVLIHGNEHDRSKCIAMSRNYIPVDLFQFHGAIASINRYSTVIECYSPFINEAFYKMYIQAKKDLSSKPIVKKFPRKDKNPCFNWLCYCVYGINSITAEKIVKTYNLQNKRDLDRLTIEQLTEIEGIGKITARKIIESIK